MDGKPVEFSLGKKSGTKSLSRFVFQTFFITREFLRTLLSLMNHDVASEILFRLATLTRDPVAEKRQPFLTVGSLGLKDLSIFINTQAYRVQTSHIVSTLIQISHQDPWNLKLFFCADVGILRHA